MKKNCLLLNLILLFFTSCNLFANEKIPYGIEGNILTEDSEIYEYMGLCDYALKDYISALMDFDKAILLSNNDEYLESRYNEIKQLLEQSEVKSDETTQE